MKIRDLTVWCKRCKILEHCEWRFKMWLLLITKAPPHNCMGLYVVALSFCLLVLIMQIKSFICLSLVRTCRAMVTLAQQRNSAGGRERLQRCCGTPVVRVPQLLGHPHHGFPRCFPRGKLYLLREIYACSGGLPVAPINAPYLLLLLLLYYYYTVFQKTCDYVFDDNLN